MTNLLIIDANILIGAVIGRSFPILEALNAKGFALVVPPQQAHEVRAVLSHRFGVSPLDLEAKLKDVWLLVDIAQAYEYSHLEARARERLTAEGQPDWPLVALAIATGAGVLSRDKHLFGTGIAVWSLFNTRFAEPDEDRNA